MPPDGLPIERLTSRCCKFAVTPDAQSSHLFCGAPADPGCVYCAAHRLIAYREYQPRPVRAQAIWDKNISRRIA